MNWNEVSYYCQTLKLDGHPNWRLSSIDELQGIYDPTAAKTLVFAGKTWKYQIKDGIILTGRGVQLLCRGASLSKPAAATAIGSVCAPVRRMMWMV